MKPVKIDIQTYQIGDYVAFKTDRGDWKLGRPVYQSEPTLLLFVEMTVSRHRRLIDCLNHMRAHARRDSMIRRTMGT